MGGIRIPAALLVPFVLIAAPARAEPPLSGADWENNGGLFEVSYAKFGWVKDNAPLVAPAALRIKSPDGLLSCTVAEDYAAIDPQIYARKREAVRKRFVPGAVKKDKFGGVRVTKSELVPGGVFRGEEVALTAERPIARHVLIAFGVDLADASWDARISCDASREAAPERWREIESVLSTLAISGDRPFPAG